MMDKLQALADASTPDEVKSILAKCGVELPPDGPEGTEVEIEVSSEPAPDESEGPPMDDAEKDEPPGDYKSMRSAALKKSAKENGMEF